MCTLAQAGCRVLVLTLELGVRRKQILNSSVQSIKEGLCLHSACSWSPSFFWSAGCRLEAYHGTE